MAANNIVEDKQNLAIEQQQCFYELLPECVRYRPDEHRYLKQNIGYAMFGPPVSSEERDQVVDQQERNNCYYKPQNVNNRDADIVDTIGYDEEATKIIEEIYDQICENAYIKTNPQSIYVGTIYNVIFFPDEKLESKKDENSHKEEEEKKKEEKKEEEKKEEEKKEKAQRPAIIPVPVFTIRLNSKKKFYIGKAANDIFHAGYTKIQPSNYETWYVDTNARVYTTWESYVTTNLLPECTMVLPKDGVYKADPDYPISEDYSTVWIEIKDSPACSTAAKVCKGIDIASTVVGIAGLGLGVASMFTPAAPIVISGLVATGASGAWTMGRCTEQLIDRGTHMKSINLFNKEAFPHWLGLAGSIAGLGTIGGGILLSRAAASGAVVGNFARVAFNTVLGGNLVLNGVGIVYMSYFMIEKYMRERTVSIIDALNLATHVMFFATSVMNVKFAGDIIQDTQGKVLKDYRSSLRNKRLRYKFNRVARRAAQNNSSVISENAEVICYIRHREQLVSDRSVAGISLDRNSHQTTWTFDKDKLIIGSIMLLSPLEFVLSDASRMSWGTSTEDFENSLSDLQEYDDTYNVSHLVNALSNLLKQFYTPDYNSSDRVEATDLISLLRHMRFLNIDEDHLQKIFEIVKELVLRFENRREVMLKAFTFVWNYCKANLEQWGIRSTYRVQSDSGSRILQKIITVISEAIDTMLPTLYEAFQLYLDQP